MACVSKNYYMGYLSNQQTSDNCTVIGVVGLIITVLLFLLKVNIFYCLLCLAICAVLLIAPVISTRRMEKYWSELEASGKRDFVLTDFGTSKSMHHDSIRLGEHYVFRRYLGVPLEYDQITRMYEYIKTSDGQVVSHSIECITVDDKKYVLCDLGRSASGAAAMEVMSAIRTHNPAIVIGCE